MPLIAFLDRSESNLQASTDKLAASLGLFAGQAAATHSTGTSSFAQTVSPHSARRWRPQQTARGTWALFAGWLDNADELAGTLGLPAESDNALIYGMAVDRWGDDADRRATGCYATITKGTAPGVRLARSPWSAPPLHFFRGDGLCAAASVTRALHACGLSGTINRQTLADLLYSNPASHEGLYQGEELVRAGEIVHLSAQEARRVQWYDPFDFPPQLRFRDPRDYVEAADELLGKAVAAAMQGARQPGIFLSGGLDSTNIAARALRIMPATARLHSFTFLPDHDWKDDLPRWQYASEEQAVRRFAQKHPRLATHFHLGDGLEFDELSSHMLLAVSTAPPVLRVLAPFAPLYDMARTEGCDLMLAGWAGNATFSSDGVWAFTEFLRTGRFVSLYRAVRDIPFRRRGTAREILRLAVMPQLPLAVQRAWQEFRGVRPPDQYGDITPLRHDAVAAFQLRERARAAGLADQQPHWSSRAAFWRNNFSEGETHHADILCGFEQLYGIRTRDPTLYRPLVEFCRAVPTDIFLRDGQQRWLARELGRGHLPEEIRTEQRHGLIGADWHGRLARRLPELRAELESAARDPILSELVDFDELRRRLDDFPAETDGSMGQFLRYTVAVPNLVLAARFLRHASGRNEP
ncbi:MAG: asparagine synthase-related protein [Novosphingobium sp.]